MDFEAYSAKYKNIQEELLSFLENEDDPNDHYLNLLKIIDEQKICATKHEFSLFLRLISSISNNHHRESNFINNIEKLLLNYEKDIKANFSNSKIFNIFKGNKRILLFLLEEKIIKMDTTILAKFLSKKYIEYGYPQYFLPEIKPYLNEQWIKQLRERFVPLKLSNDWIKIITDNELPENFYELRKIGENENYVCELIRNDRVEDFIAYINRNNYSPNSTIKPSFYETNPFLIKEQIDIQKKNKPMLFGAPINLRKLKKNFKLTLIQYATFFGSIEILKYLQFNNVVFTQNLLLFAIHGQNSEIIHILEEDKSKIDETTFKKAFEESIKCHHNNFANYFLENYFQNNDISNFFVQILKYSNYSFFQDGIINESTFYYMCSYEYYWLVDLFLKEKSVDLNKIIQNHIFQLHSNSNHIF